MKNNKDTNNGVSTLNIIISTLVLFSTTTYFVYSFFNINNKINGLSIFIGSIILELFGIFFFITSLTKNKSKNVLNVFSGILIISFITFNILDNNNILKIKKLEIIKNFIGKNINEAIIYGNDKKIDISYTYEYSDNIKEGFIISQDILPNEFLKDVKKLSFVVSSGPNYDKEVILTNFEGSNISDVIAFINKNYLNNVNIIYEVNNELEKDTIINQNIKGNIKRNSSITFKVSLGNKDSLVPTEIENMEGKSLFDATLYLKRNGILYEVSYDFSETVKKGDVISQDPKEGTVTPLSTKVKLVISKGNKIIVPNLKDMEISNIVSWATENNIKIKFNEEYHKEIGLGKIIKTSHKENDVVSDGDTITITTSKGPLKLINTYNLAEFKTWASTYNVDYSVKYDYSDTVTKGKIIKYSQEVDSIIDFEKTITVTVSNGKPITVPNFVGKSKSNITSTCNSLGLNCTFYYIGYSSTTKDVATKQNVKANTVVVSGTYVSIGLSSGPAKTFNVYIQDSWFGRTADATISTLKTKLASAAPGVTFTFVKKNSNTGASSGMIHENSPVKGGYNSFTQGKTYTIWIIN